MKYVDLLKISEEEAELLLDKSSIEEYEDKLLAMGIKFVAVTAGAKGAYYASERVRGYMPALDVKAVDTTGAGDIFWGTFLHFMLKAKPALDDEKALEYCIEKATRAAGLSTQKTGAVPSIPTIEEIE
jgi:fructokinase